MSGKLIGVGEHEHARSENARFYARICYKGKQVWLGYFPCELLAAAAYNRAAKKYGKRQNVLPDCEDCVGSSDFCDTCPLNVDQDYFFEFDED